MIDWELFAERVPAGTRVQDRDYAGKIYREGILLETYPHRQDEEIYYYPSSYALEKKNLHESPTLTVQWFPEMHSDGHRPLAYPLDDVEPYALTIHKWVVFLVNDQWLTLAEVMSDAS